jgi:hypothetical protein
MATKHPMSPNSFHFIKPRNSHCPFASSCSTTNLSSTSSPMQTTNHPLVTLLILINHTPPTSAPYQPLTLHVKEGSKPYTFLNPLNHAQLRHFPPPTVLVPIIGLDHTPNLPPFLQHTFNLHLKYCVPHVGANFLIKG